MRLFVAMEIVLAKKLAIPIFVHKIVRILILPIMQRVTRLRHNPPAQMANALPKKLNQAIAPQTAPDKALISKMFVVMARAKIPKKALALAPKTVNQARQIISKS